MRLKPSEIQEQLDNDYVYNWEDEVGPVVDDGIWTVETSSDGKDVYLANDGFHDVIMRINGDFGSIKRKAEYAQLLANRLNPPGYKVLSQKF